MQRTFLFCLIVLALEPIRAQDVFVAPTERTVIATTEQSNSDDPAHSLYISNNSTVPIVVFGITLTQCENVKQSCGPRRTNIKIGAGRRVNVGRVQARDTERGFGYRWNFSYHADSSDAKALALLREHGIELDPAAAARRAAAELAAADARAADARAANAPAAPVAMETASTQPELAPDSDARRVTFRSSSTPPRPPSRTLRFKLGWGSILGSTMVPDKPIQVTGSCVDPAQTGKLEKDPAIEKMPWRPARVYPSFAEARLPTAMRDSMFRLGGVVSMPEVLVRFAADTSGAVIPESVSVLESPDGQLSVNACKALFSADVEPAKNRQGRPVATWIQTTLRAMP
jgi:hypothetical protein